MQRKTKIGCIVIIIAIVAIFATIFLLQFLFPISSGNNNVVPTSLNFESVYETYRPSYNTTDGWYNRVTIPAQLQIYGTTINKEDKTLYNCQLHIICYYAGGIIALDTYVKIGVGTQNAIYVNGQIPIDLTINCTDGITNWKVTPFCTNNP
jgi:hypothetical protein